MSDDNKFEVLELQQPSQAQLVGSLDYVERTNVDIQVATAHQFPRDLTRCINTAISIVTMDAETAQSCTYALPRGGRPITGPSVHLAKILAQQYGNLRAEAKVVSITDKHVISRGVAWDLENNYAVAFEVRRSILDKNGNRFKEDMITVTGNAANSIAYRNAVFGVIPQALVKKAYQASQRCITGDLSDEEKLVKRRSAAIQHFSDNYGITEKEIVQLCGKQTVNQIRANEIAVLLGIVQALNDGDTTVEDIMAPIRQTKEVKSNRLSDIAREASAKRKAREENTSEE